MKKLIVAVLIISSLPSCFAQEIALDPMSKITKANLVCGKLDGKFMIFSSQLKKIWYVISDASTDDIFKSARTPGDIEGIAAYTYSMLDNSYPFPVYEREGGSAVVTYRLPYGRSSIFLNVRKDSNGNFRVFKGENGRNTLCSFLKEIDGP